MIDVPVSRLCGDNDTQEDSHRKMEVEIGATLSEVMRHQESPGARREKEGFWRPLKGAWPCWHFGFRFLAPEPWVKELSEKVGLKLNIKKTNIMVSGPITSQKIDGETVETETLILGAPKSLEMVTSAMKLKDICSLEEKLWPT